MLGCSIYVGNLITNKLIRRIIESRWFSWADLISVLLCGALSYGWPALGGWPLLIALLPWGGRLIAGRFPYQRTRFDLPLAVFLITALSGVWAAYDRESAWAKFWLLLTAALLYYALARQPHTHLWPVAGLLSLLGGWVASYFLLTQDWQSQPADIEILNQIGRWWMSVRPSVQLRALHPNSIGGILAMLSGFPLAVWVRAWHTRRIGMASFAGVASGLMGIGLLLTSSRGAWLTLMAAAGVWCISRFSNRVARRVGLPPKWLVALALLVISAGVWGLINTYPGGLLGLTNRLPGAPSGSSRLDLVRNTFALSMDFPFTGGGLGAFSGLYSRYMMVIPVFLFGYSHNLFLDVLLEQGLFGFLALASVLLGSAWLMIAQARRTSDRAQINLLRGAALVGLWVVILHGLVDDALYVSQGTPLLFLLAGMAISMAQPGLTQAETPTSAGPLETRAQGRDRQEWKVIGLTIALVALISLLFALWKPLLAKWYANLGAVQMARAELSGWPARGWDEGRPLFELAPAEASFNQALRLDPNNQTARYRLGLVAALKDDYATAAAHLDKAYQADGTHRGVRKVLGYLYVWMGRSAEALPLLSGLPEAGHEMSTYVRWWRIRGRDEQAAYAAQMAAFLQAQAQTIEP